MSDFKAERRWLTWRMRGTQKVPCTVEGDNLAEWQEPKSWLNHDEATDQLRRLPFPPVSSDGRRNAGLGRVDGDGWAHVDIDHCQDNDPFLVLLQGTGCYVERSPSHTGWHAIGRGSRSIEVTYKGGSEPVLKDLGRFLTVTGIDATGDPEVNISSALDAIQGHFGRGASETSQMPCKKPLPEVIRAGTQNQEFFREGCRHARDGKTEDEIFGILRALKDRAPASPGAAPWSDHDFHVLARSCSRYRPSDDTHETDDAGGAAFFVQQHADVVRYDHRRGRWLVWDDVRWAPDLDGKVTRFLIESSRTRVSIANRISDDSIRKSRLGKLAGGAMRRKLEDVRIIAQDLPPVTSAGNEWDTNLWLLGVPNGVIDLRTGLLRAGRPDDMITMQTEVPYEPATESPLWDRTIKDIFKHEPELLPYVQRALGYSITGDMREEVFFILTGTGRNGKGTIVNTIVKILGDYADGLKFASLEVKYSSDGGTGASPDMAKLHRKRLVVASEGSGSSLNTSLVKQITGRDPMIARFLRENEFRFEPELKLWLTAQNDKRPRVKDDSEGFWSRPHEIKFQQSYKGREDLALKDKLMTEGPGILAWLVRGCLAWQRDGLQAPECVRRAVAEYRRDQEPLADFYSERCTFDSEDSEYAMQLFQAYAGWCDARKLWGTNRLGQKIFFREIAKRVGPSQHTNKGTLFSGIGLLEPGGESDGSDGTSPFSYKTSL